MSLGYGRGTANDAPFLLIAAVLAASPSHAQMFCDDRDSVVARLHTEYGEVPINRGITVNGLMFEVFASPDGETWTTLLTDTNGVSCMMIVGESWDAVSPPKDAM